MPPNGPRFWARWPGMIRFSFFCATAVRAKKCWEEFGSFQHEDQSRGCRRQRICRTGVDQANREASGDGICRGNGCGGNRRKAAGGNPPALARSQQPDHVSSGPGADCKDLQLDTVFLCTPDKVSYDLVPKMLSLGIRVIDFSGAFRLKDVDSYSSWYGFQHANPELLNASGVRSSRMECQDDRARKADRQSGLLSDVRDAGIASADTRRECWRPVPILSATQNRA